MTKTAKTKDRYFPLASMRPAQRRSLDFIEEAWGSGKNTVVLQLPVGVGKSPLALAASRLSSEIPFDDDKLPPDEDSYILTTQKVLQAQYVKDFGDLLCNISSKTNYECRLLGNHEGCDQGMLFKKQMGCDVEEILKDLPKNMSGQPVERALVSLRDRGKDTIPCGSYGECPYRTAFVDWVSSPVSLTNIAFFMNLVKSAGVNDPDRYKRSLLIVDEAHLLEDEIIGFCEIELPKSFVTEELKIEMPWFENVTQMQDWVADSMLQAIFRRKKALADMLAVEIIAGGETAPLNRKLARIEGHLRKAVAFCESDMDNWVVCDNDDGQSAKPIHTGVIGPDLILRYGRRRLLMSGTILDKEMFCGHLGIDLDDVAFHDEPSPFDVDNRIVVRRYVGGMGRANQKETMPKMVKELREILREHKDEKGIIHTGSYKLSQTLAKELQDARIISHATSRERDAALVRHAESKAPTVLLSPSMGTGVDLKGDLARWGVMCKMPYPYLGDARIKALFDTDRRWYVWKTAQDIVQCCGRIVRSEDDEGIMYILDSDFDKVLSQGGSMFPRWWLEGLAHWT
jgi:ATP-dependent DNA helicase DinG